MISIGSSLEKSFEVISFNCFEVSIGKTIVGSTESLLSFVFDGSLSSVTSVIFDF